MTDLVTRLVDGGALSTLDVALARGLSELGKDDRDEIRLSIALASRATREGHVCADLRALGGAVIKDREGEALAECPPFDVLRAALSTSSLVGDGSRPTPLVLDARGRLYLHRHFDHERRLAEALRTRAARAIEPRDPSALRALLATLFGPRGAETDWQRVAAELATVSALTVVSGGPGTGKTTTVTKILALCLSDALARGASHPRALLLAPTGKAAARLAEAAAEARQRIDCPSDLRERLPVEASTIHRALQTGRDGRFRLNAERQLFADIVVVDEASMVDVSLMRHLVEAVPDTARLVLLGDRHQLSSVEAGAVLADVCGDAPGASYSASLGERIERAFGEPLPATSVRSPSIDDAVVALTRSHRFTADSALGRLAAAVQRGDAASVLSLLEAGGPELARLEPKNDRQLAAALHSEAVRGFRLLHESPSAESALDRLSTFRILCAHRTGPLGVEELNQRVAKALAAVPRGPEAGLLHPLLVTRNDAALGLFNGDVGVAFQEPGKTGARAAFRGSDGGVRSLSPARLPPHEPAFAMSIHKSQGSEFDEVLVVMPAPGSPLLSRELLYTAVTRARRRVVVHGSVAAIREAVSRPAVRASGLSEALRRVVT